MIKNYIEDYLSVNLMDYPNIGIGINLEISKILLGLMVVLCIAFFVVNWHRGYMSYAVRQLFRHEATAEDRAKTLKELGLSGSRSVKWALSRDTRLAKIIKRVGAPEYTYEEYVALSKKKDKGLNEKFNIDEARFYIDESTMTAAKNVHENYNASIPRTVAFCVMCIIVFIGLTLMMPGLLSFIDSTLAG